MDFVSDRVSSTAVPFRILTVVDCHTREALSLTPRANFRAYQVTEALDALAGCGGDPRACGRIMDRSSPAALLDQWAYLNGVEIDFSRPGKPTDNAYIESFNGRLRAECLNASWFLSLADAREASRNGGATTTKIDPTRPWVA